MRTKKTYALDLVDDIISDYFYYNRKDDDVLGRNDMKALIESGELTADEIVERFREGINDAMANFNLLK